MLGVRGIVVFTSLKEHLSTRLRTHCERIMSHVRICQPLRRGGTVSLLGALLLAGCHDGPEGPPRVKTVRVTGQVTVDGDPEPMLAVSAKPVVGETPTHTTPAGFTDKEGRFSLSTYEANDGIPAGEYKLLFRLGQINMMTGQYSGDLFNGKYSDPEKAEKTVTVTDSSEAIDVGLIELTTDNLPVSKKGPPSLGTDER